MKATTARCSVSALAAAIALIIASCDAGQPTGPETAAGAFAQSRTAGGPNPARRPFHGTTHGQVVNQTLAPEGRCPPQLPLLFEYNGSGVATIMGHITIEGSECVFFDPADLTSLASGHSVFVITAAHGDWIKVGYARAQVAIVPMPTPWVVWTAPMQFIEGGGRFADAQLNVTWKGGGNLMTLETYSTFDGAIIY